MPVKNCPACGKSMNAELSRCPWCGDAGASDATVRASSSGETRPCPFCREPIQDSAVKCRWCGETVGKAPPPVVTATPAASPSTLPPPQLQPPPGTTPLVLGIIGIVACQMLAPFAWYMGRQYEAQCRAMGVEPDGNGKAGKVLGIVGTILLGIQLLCVVAYILFAVLAVGAAAVSN